MKVLPAAVVRGDQTSAGIEQVEALVRWALEVEYSVEGSSKRVKGTGDALAAEPVVLNEAEDGGLVGDHVVDVVGLCVRRDHEQRKAGTVAATTLRVLNVGAG